MACIFCFNEYNIFGLITYIFVGRWLAFLHHWLAFFDWWLACFSLMACIFLVDEFHIFVLMSCITGTMTCMSLDDGLHVFGRCLAFLSMICIFGPMIFIFLYDDLHIFGRLLALFRPMTGSFYTMTSLSRWLVVFRRCHFFFVDSGCIIFLFVAEKKITFVACINFDRFELTHNLKETCSLSPQIHFYSDLAENLKHFNP